ncbi:MAG: hypothetical protein ACRESZ_04840 [Methylococcales bacterium]
MKTYTFKTSTIEVFSDILKTLKSRILILAQVTVFSSILAVTLLATISLYVAFSLYINWIILGATTVVIANYVLTGQVCDFCIVSMQKIAWLARLFRRKIFPVE